MDVKKLRTKTVASLEKQLQEISVRLKELRFKISSNQLKNIREVRVMKRTSARIQTILNEKKVKESVKSE
jgi:large subunit ribosomal protein L29